MVWKLRGQAPNAQVDHLSNAQFQSISVYHGGHETHWKPTHHESQRPPSDAFGYFQQIPSGYDIHSLPWKITMLLRTANHHKPSISMGHGFHGELLVITRWYPKLRYCGFDARGRSWQLRLCEEGPSDHPKPSTDTELDAAETEWHRMPSSGLSFRLSCRNTLWLWLTDIAMV